MNVAPCWEVCVSACYLIGRSGLSLAYYLVGPVRLSAGSQECVSMRVCEAHQLSDGSQASASDPQFGKSVKDMPRWAGPEPRLHP